MEQVTNPLNINDLLLRLKSSNIARDFKNILEALTVHCIDLDLNLIDVGEDKLERNIKAIRSLEKVIIYLFSEYNSILKQYDGTLTKKAMQLCALASEKIGDYLNHVNEEKLETLSQDQVLNKQLKMYWRATIAYTLCDNPPNSFVVVEKFEKVLSKLESKEIISNEMRNIYKFSYFLLRRYFINNIEKHIDDEELIGIFIELRAFVLTGDRTSAENAVQLLDRLIKNTLSTYRTNEFWHLKYLASCIERIISNSIWNNLTDIFSGTYLQQLIKSKPPVLELWPNQVEVVNNPEGYLRNQEIKRTMINFPTSGGKSLLAEFAIVRELERDITKKCFYIVPTNALVYEVTKRLRDRFRRLGYKVSSSISGYEPDFVYGNFSEDNVVVTTPEKLEMIIRNNLSNDLLSNISLIIFDEFHKIQDRERGWVIEGSISYLINHEIFSRIKIIMLSAIIDNVPTVMEWVDETKQCSSHLPNNWKPTIKLKGVVSWEIEKDKYGKWLQLSPKDGLYRKGYKNFRASARIKYRMNDTERQLVLFRAARYLNKRDNKVAAEVNIKKENFIMGVAQKLKNIGGSLIFFHSKDECEEFVRNYTPMFPERLEINDEIKHLILYIEKRLGSNHLLTIGLNKGLVYHHGSLPIDIREALEDYYLKGHIKIMVCTTTLVEGVNFPIQNFIHSGRSYQGQRTLSPGDFKNIVGRAGRAYQSTFGQIIYINYFNNVIDEHLNYEQHPNIVYSSLVGDDKFFDALTEVENTEQELQLSLLLGLTSYPFVKSLLLFYNTLSPRSENIDGLLNKTLFSLQADSEKIGKVKRISRKMYSYYDTQSREDLVKIQESGLSFVSYRILQKLSLQVIEKYNSLGGIVSSISDIISSEMYVQILGLKESEKFVVRKSSSRSDEVEINDYQLFVDWIESNKTFKQLSEEYFRSVEEQYRMTRIVEYSREMFEFKLPWVFGTLCSMVIDAVGNIDYFMYLPLFIKYGVNHSVDVNLFKLGLNSRETVKDLSSFIQNNTVHRTVDELRNYLKEVDPLTFLNDDKRITPFEVRKLVALSNNYKEVTDVFNEYGICHLYVAGTRYYFCQLPERDMILSKLNVGSELTIIREHKNFFDENAVEVYFGNHKLGYIPRQYNEEVSYYLDLNSRYKLQVESVKVVDVNRYIELKIQLTFDL